MRRRFVMGAVRSGILLLALFLASRPETRVFPFTSYDKLSALPSWSASGKFIVCGWESRALGVEELRSRLSGEFKGWRVKEDKPGSYWVERDTGEYVWIRQDTSRVTVSRLMSNTWRNRLAVWLSMRGWTPGGPIEEG